MSEYDTTEVEGSDIEPRTRRALERVASVTPDIGRAKGAAGMALVTSRSGSTYLVDVRGGRCECPDAQHRDPDGGCWHVRRARMALGLDALPADAVAALDVDETLGEHTDASLQFATADGGAVDGDSAGDETAGGRLFAGRSAGRYETEDVDGGVLVFDRDCDGVGRELVGLAEIADRAALRQSLARRGFGVGALHQLEVFDPTEGRR